VQKQRESQTHSENCSAIESGNELDSVSVLFILLPRENERSSSSIGTPNALGFAV
jgi:hypothetical protein